MTFSRRSFVEQAMSLCLIPAWSMAFDDMDAQPLARISHFPQMATGGVGVTPCGSLRPPTIVPALGRVAARDEPGEPLRITGTIYSPDSVTPARDVMLFLYHTDAHGHYNQPNNPFNPRIYGWVKSDAKGRYGFVTIKPAPYPELNTPAHIHVSIFGPGFPEYWADDYWFEGDPLITPRQLTTLTGRGGFQNIVKLSRDGDGVLQGTRNFALQHGFSAGSCQLLT
jgi:protocatechuate 3,4-dioxygenase beta subunit